MTDHEPQRDFIVLGGKRPSGVENVVRSVLAGTYIEPPPVDGDYAVCRSCRVYIRLGHWNRHARGARHAKNEDARVAEHARLTAAARRMRLSDDPASE